MPDRALYDPIDQALCWITGTISLGGSLFAQASESPQVTLGAIVLALIGILTLSIRGLFGYLNAKLDVSRLRTELEVYRRMCAKEHLCPFTPDHRPACAEPDQVDATVEQKFDREHAKMKQEKADEGRRNNQGKPGGQ